MLQWNSVVTVQTHAWSDYLLLYWQQINRLFQEVCLSSTLKIWRERLDPAQMKDWLYLVLYDTRNFLQKITCTLSTSWKWKHRPSFLTRPQNPFISNKASFSGDPVPMVTLVPRRPAVWAFQPCSTWEENFQQPSCKCQAGWAACNAPCKGLWIWCGVRLRRSKRRTKMRKKMKMEMEEEGFREPCHRFVTWLDVAGGPYVASPRGVDRLCRGPAL